MGYIIGVDIGGTKVAIGLVEKSGRLLEEITLPTNLNISPVQMIEEIILEINKLLTSHLIEDENLVGIGIGAPGPLNSDSGIILCPPNLPNWRNIEILKQFQQSFSCPILLENDANAATLAEKWVGAAKNCNLFIYLTISTGIGAGIYADGKLIRGASGNAGDIGHMVVDPSYGQCSCGQEGCLEWIASGTAIARLGSEIIGKEIKAEEVFQFYNQGDPAITELINKTFKNIGVGCVSLINAFDPEKIIIGGGVSKVGKPLFESVQKYVQQYALNPNGRKIKIVPSGLGGFGV